MGTLGHIGSVRGTYMSDLPTRSVKENMEELYDVNDMDTWYLGTQPSVKKGQANLKTYALYYCENCESVWEISCTGTILRYKHLPTYGKTRITCRHCKNGNNKTYQQTNGTH